MTQYIPGVFRVYVMVIKANKSHICVYELTICED